MRLTLFRHGLAGRADPERWPGDRERPLTRRGRERTSLAARGLAQLLGGPVRIWTSPYVRAEQTAQLLAQALDGSRVTPVAALSPAGSQRVLLDRLSALPADADVVLVGHEPALGVLAGLLLAASPAALPLRKAGACAIAFDGPARRRSGELLWYVPPRLLRALAGRKRL